jgi:hypothetical protein
MRPLAITRLAILVSAHMASGQQTTTTDCTLNSNTAHCTSDSTNYAAQQQRAYEQGQQAGQALGQGIGVAMQAHAFDKNLRKYCAAHPGENWNYYSRVDGHVMSSGHCPSDDEKGVAAANDFMSRHKDFKPGETNSQVMTKYLETHNLDPREERSFERAYKDLKNTGQLDLYAK